MSEVLQLTVHEGSGLSGGLFGSKDPYVIVRMGGQQVHTNAVPNAGKSPKWEQSFTMMYNGEDRMELVVMDKDTTTKDDLMGEGYLDLGPIRVSRRMTTNVPISRKSKPAGTVRVTAVLKGSHHNSPMPPHHYPGVIPMQNMPGQAIPVYSYQVAPPAYNMGGYAGIQYPPAGYGHAPYPTPSMAPGGVYYPTAGGYPAFPPNHPGMYGPRM